VLSFAAKIGEYDGLALDYISHKEEMPTCVL
jgi:hypothetical protein